MAARWRVTNDQPRENLTSAGTFESSREITFELLDSGRIGTVMVALRNYTPEQVTKEIQNYADNIAAIGALGNE